MSEEAKPGQCVISTKEANCTCIYTAVVFLCLGFVLGGATAHYVYADVGEPIRVSLRTIGDSLCKDFGKLKRVGRVSDGLYWMECHELAVFPKVPITFKERQ